MNVEIFTFCDFAQENGGKLTIVGTFDTIITHQFPAVHPMVVLVVRIRFHIGEFCEHDFRIEMRNIDGDRCMAPISGKIEVRGVGNATAVTHLLFNMSNLCFKNAGVINFTLFIDDRELASIPLYLRKG